MVKLVFLCRRRPDITREQYATLLLDGHVPLALRHHPRMRRYVVNLIEHAGADAPPLDSIGALWFDSLAEYREHLYDSPEGARLIARDVARFLGGADAYVTAEHVVTAPGRPEGDKTILCLRRAPGVGVEAFRTGWLERVPVLAGERGYVASLVDQCLSGAAAYDGIAEIGAPLATAVEMHRGVADVAHAYGVREHVARR